MSAISGKRAQSNGKMFEQWFEASCITHQMVVTRMPDGCVMRRRGRSVVAVRVKTPFDWIITFQGRTCFLDTKTTEGKTFPPGKITPHQLAELLRHSDAGALAGYVVHFREVNVVSFVPVSRLQEAFLARKAISFEDHALTQLNGGGWINPVRMFPVTKTP